MSTDSDTIRRKGKHHEEDCTTFFNGIAVHAHMHERSAERVESTFNDNRNKKETSEEVVLSVNQLNKVFVSKRNLS